MKKRQVIISKEWSVGYEEEWVEWFKCPNCNSIKIQTSYKYCPNCGYKIFFEKDASEIMRKILAREEKNNEF